MITADQALARMADAVVRLDMLGTPDAIAAFLERRGIRGLPNHSCHCPVAVYLARCTDGWDCRVGADAVRLFEEPLPLVVLPATLRLFIREFDAHRYPQLIIK